MLFKNKYSFLSNMCSFGKEVRIKDLLVRSVENYYQAMKTENTYMRNFILTLNSYEAKRIGKDIALSDDFLKDKIQIMKDALDIKFNIPIFKYLLLSTKDTKLVEDNYWKDTFWGVCDGVGENNLGKLLMEKRAELKKIAALKSKIKIGNLYNNNIMNGYDYIGFTSNSTLNKNNELIMGAGTALEIKTLYPELPKVFGDAIINGNKSFIVNPKTKIFSFRTKDDWKENSKFELIEESLTELIAFANKNKNKRFALPVPGISNGGLDIDFVLPLLLNLPNNIDLWKLPTSKIYTGIGSRTLPEEYRLRVETIAKLCYEKGFTLRSGGADGSDLEFEQNSNSKEIYLPWKGFNNNKSELYETPVLSETFAFFHHVGYDYLKQSVKKLMNRNVLQVLGRKMTDPSDFIVCYTEDGCNSYKTRTAKTGGTGLAISLGSTLGIPVFNVKNDKDYSELVMCINSL